jgi:hypothetical protein
MKPLRSFRFLFPLALVGMACSSILGIEDVHEGPKSGSGADGGDNGNGGTSGNRGGTSGTSGNAGSAGNAGNGTGGTSGASGTSGTGGAAGDMGGGGDGNMGGGGTGGAPDGTVRGRVVNQWLQPIPDVLVTIGLADAMTNDDGEFEIPDVAPQYDAAFTLTYTLYGLRVYGWVYQGLTRRDPTLMAEDGLTGREATLLTNVNATLDNSRAIYLGFGAPSGEAFGISSLAAYYSASWLGPETTTVTAHMLLWEHTNNLPTAYRAYDSELLALTDGGDPMVTFDLPDGNITSGAIAGSVTSTTADDRLNQVFVRFTTNGTLEVVNDAPTDPAAFTYLVPSIPNSSITVAASETGPQGFAVAHLDALAPGQTGLDIEIPDPTLLTSPAIGVTGVDSTTQFRWNGTTNAYFWYIEDDDYYQGIRVITGAESATIPALPDGFALRAGGLHYWLIETHGSARSVDEMCGPEGFGDSFAWGNGYAPVGPRQGSGSYTQSLGRLFTTSP